MKVWLEDMEYLERYKLDLEIAYYVDDREVDIPPDVVLDKLSFNILDLIYDNMDDLCADLDIDDFQIFYTNYNESNSILTYEVDTETKIIGEYLVSNLSQILDEYETVLEYNGEEHVIKIASILPMLRYIGES